MRLLASGMGEAVCIVISELPPKDGRLASKRARSSASSVIQPPRNVPRHSVAVNLFLKHEEQRKKPPDESDGF